MSTIFFLTDFWIIFCLLFSTRIIQTKITIKTYFRYYNHGLNTIFIILTDFG